MLVSVIPTIPLLIFTIAISFEIKAGKITKDKFVNIQNNEEYKAILVSSRVLMDNRQFYIKEFDNIFLSSLVPVLGFVLSTLSLKFIRKIWEKRN